MAPPLPDHIERLQNAATDLAYFDQAGNWPQAAATAKRCFDELGEIYPLIVERCIRSGMTQRRTADLLGVPARTLEGAKRAFGRG